MLNSTQTIEPVEPKTDTDHGSPSSSFPVVSIEKIVSGGLGLGRVGSQVVLVPGALPGEKLSVRIGGKRGGVPRADIQQILHSSNDRIEPSCPIVGKCGGCQFQHQTYQSQVNQKRTILQEALVRIGKLSVPDIPAVVASPRTFHYRTSIRFVVFREGNGFQLGFYRQGTRLPIQAANCLLIPEPAKELVTRVGRCLSSRPRLPIYLDSLEIRWSDHLSQGLLIFRGTCRQKDQALALLNMLDPLPEVAGIIFEASSKNRSPRPHSSIVLSGQDHLFERFLGLTLRIGYRSFAQANWPVYEMLGETLLEWGSDLNGQRILELYAGVGALGMSFARRGAKATMVEAHEGSFSDGRRSATLNHVGRCRFRSDTAERFLSTTSVGEYDVILVDPPRAGLSTETIQALGRIQVPRIFYVSCDPATLARDLFRLSTFGYTIRRLQPFDMFPQTAHIETLVELTL